MQQKYSHSIGLSYAVCKRTQPLNVVLQNHLNIYSTRDWDILVMWSETHFPLVVYVKETIIYVSTSLIRLEPNSDSFPSLVWLKRNTP